MNIIKYSHLLEENNNIYQTHTQLARTPSSLYKFKWRQNILVVLTSFVSIATMQEEKQK